MNPKRIADLSVLLKECPASYYWMGFLIADGHFYETAIKLHLAEADRDHIEKFRKFVSYTGKAKSCTMNAMNPMIVKQIREKFDVSNRKTYCPCDIKWMLEKPDLFFSFIVGMIDGDGHLAKRKGMVSSIAVKLHKNWLGNLKIVEKFLYEYFLIERFKRYKKNFLSKIIKSGYAQIILSDTSLISAMKQKSLEMNLPFMLRKWHDVKHIEIRNEQLVEMKWLKIKEMLDSGMSRKQISEAVGMKHKSLNVLVWRRSA